MQFTPIVVQIAGTDTTFVAEMLTPQETTLRSNASGPYNTLQNVKVGFSAPNQGRPNSFTTSRVYKTPVVDADGKVVGLVRTDVKTTIPLTASAADRAKHGDLVAEMESNAGIVAQSKDLVSWY